MRTKPERILLLLLTLLGSTVQAQDKPNILVIWGDEIGRASCRERV